MTVDEQARQRISTDSPSPVPAAVQVRSRRNPKWIALGIVAICLGAIASFFLYSHVSQAHQVIAVRQTVHRGATITAQDLGQVRVGDTGGVATVPAADLNSLIGKVAAFDLVQGSLLPPDAVTDSLPPDHGKAIIGIHLESGRAPAGFLAPGSPVRVVVLPVDAGGGGTGADGGTGSGAGTTGGEPDQGAEPSSEPTSSSPAEVTNVATLPAVVINSSQLDDGVYLNLQLDSKAAVDAASYAAQGRVVVVRDSER